MSEAMLNDPSAPLSGIRKPLFRVLANGSVVGGGLSLEVQSNNHYSPDTFNIEVALNAPQAKGLDFWGGTDTIVIEIQAGLTAGADGSLPAIFTGEVDNVEADPITGTVQISGRDLSRRLVDNKTHENFQNSTSSEVAAKLAVRRGLTPVVTKTTTLISRFYIEDHDHLTGDQFSRTTTEWDLLVYLAQLERFDVFVINQELHFQPVTTNSSAPFVVRLDSAGPVPKMNVENLHLNRSLTLAKDIEVWVRSWHPHKKTGHTVKAKGKKSTTNPATNGQDAVTAQSGHKGADTQRVVIVIPNLDQTAAQQLADSVRADLTQHERVIEFEMPGDNVPNVRDRVLLQGTDSSWDQSYFVSTITRQLSWSSGYRMTVKAKNTSPANETLPGYSY